MKKLFILLSIIILQSCGPSRAQLERLYKTTTVQVEVQTSFGNHVIDVCTKMPINGSDVSLSLNLDNGNLKNYWGEIIATGINAYRILPEEPQTETTSVVSPASLHTGVYVIDLPPDYTIITNDKDRPNLMVAWISNDTLKIRFRK